MGRQIQIESSDEIYGFISESNRIEGIEREPMPEEFEEYHRFMALREVTIEDMEQFVKVCQPDAFLRDTPGINVMVGNYFPPVGGPFIRTSLKLLLEEIGVLSPFQAHVRYEKLHPFTDGNGRSGRMLWKWQMRRAPLGFLHTFYYQSLEARQ